MKNRPTDRLPRCITNNHSQCTSKSYSWFYRFLDIYWFIIFHVCFLHKSRVIPLSIPRFFPAEKIPRTKGLSGNYPHSGSYTLTTMYREGYRVLLTLLQFFATKFLFLALHLEAGSFPRPLSPQEEIRTFADLRAGDPSAREKLIRHNLRLVAHIAKKYYALPSEQDDLISIGTIGLMKAVDTFDSTRRARFSTYASRCIENAILNLSEKFLPFLCGRHDDKGEFSAHQLFTLCPLCFAVVIVW